MSETKLDAEDQQILAERETAYHARLGPQVGDYCRMPDGSLRRFTHHWGDSIQTSDGGWGSYYLGANGTSYSGGLDPAVPIAQIAPTGETAPAVFWFFHHNEWKAHNAVEFAISVPVWVIGKAGERDLRGANLSDADLDGANLRNADTPAAEPLTVELAESAGDAGRVYRIERQRDGRVKCEVMFARFPRVGPVVGAADYPLQNLSRHSPTGFECGYSGSGPADLAFSILADFFYGGSGRLSSFQYDVWRGCETEKERAEVLRRAEQFHHDFKLAFITPLSLLIGESKDIAAAEIAQWVAGRQ